MGTLVRILVVVLVVYLGWAGLLWFGQRSVLYPGATRRTAPAGPPPMEGLERLWLDTSVGKVEAWRLAPAGDSPGPKPAVVYFHGNGELIDDWPRMTGGLRERGFHVLLVEYPGYGRSEGKPGQGPITEAALAAWDSLVARDDVDPRRIVAYGRSLGGGAACRLAAERPVAALALTSAFTSVRDFARGYLLPGFLVKDPFDNVAVVREFDGPVLVTHGRLDATIPHRHGRRLAAAAKHGRLVSLDCAHNDCPPDFEAHWDDVAGLVAGPD
jgi:pimeloyl-ACP methyl ester carboxylesterase